MRRRIAGALMVVIAGAGLFGAPGAFSHEPDGTLLSRRQTVALANRIVPRGKDPSGWGRDVFEALKRNGIRTTRQNVCSVMAVIEQESTFTANPEVKGLGRMAEKEIEEKVRSIPLLPAGAHAGVHLFLATRPSPEKSYLKLIRAAKTERDLDLVFRNMAFYLFREYATTRLLNTPAVAGRVDAVNPVSTLGSMQVSISYAAAEVEKAKGRRLTASAIWKLRDELYTRAGGVNYGTRMLLGYHAGYGSRLYVFADFNAGRFASRNAAFQHMVAELSGDQLALDGDLLIYGKGEAQTEPSATEKAVRRLGLGLGEKEIRADLLQGKAFGFRDTATYHRVSAAYEKKIGRKAPYAMVPQIRLKSPKITSNMTTERFARAVMRRYEKCLKLR
ncbi:DUF1615 family protein [Aestuariivirga sp.]|uniref:DUF1615 family protein n=1 Tax=Aestuariivirga sp. TaxID=2650926 RepID=UPI00391C5EC9